jgi:hypothetical protein
VRQPTRKTRGSRRLTIRYVVSRSRWYTSCRTGAFDLAGVSRYQPNDLKRACVDLRGRCQRKPRHAGGVLSESRGRLVRFAAAREAESGEAQTEQCDCGGFGDETDRIAVYREGVCAPAMAKRVRDQFKS